MRYFRIAFAFVVVGVVSVGVFAFLAGFADGPLGPFPGGAMSGDVDPTSRPDWTVAGETIEMEIRPEDPWSLQTYAIPHRGELFVPSFMAPRRRWVPVALADPRVLVRLKGKLYPRTLVRVEDAALRAELIGRMAELFGYGQGSVAGSDDTWYFQLVPRAEASVS